MLNDKYIDNGGLPITSKLHFLGIMLTFQINCFN